MEIAITLVGLVIAWLTYKKTFHYKPAEDMEHLLIQFRATQTMSKQVQRNLKELAEKNNWFDEEIFPNITYEQYKKEMEISYQTNLSDSLYQKIKSENLTKSIILSMTRSIEQQFNALQLLKTETEIKLKK